MLGWKTCKCCHETDELPNPKAQPNPRRIRLNVVFEPLFPTEDNFSWVGIGFYTGNRLQESNLNQILRKHPIVWLIGQIMIRVYHTKILLNEKT